jgi:FkbM family methyltransferase
MFTRHGEFVSHGSTDLIGKSLEKYGEWAQNEIDFISQFIHPRDVVLDVGAHVGVHSRAFSKLVGPSGHVHAFEPNPASQQLLLENIRLAPTPNITAHLFAASRQNKTSARAADTANNTGNFHIMPDTESDAAPSVVTVPTRSLDSLGLDVANFIKVDVEGHEVDVLKGGLALIAKSRPVVFCEANHLDDAAKLFSFASNIGYEVFHVRSRAFNIDNSNGSQEDFFEGACENNVLLAPRERDVAKTLSWDPDKIEVRQIFHVRDAEDIYLPGRSVAEMDSVNGDSRSAKDKLPIIMAISFYQTANLIPFIAEGLLSIAEELKGNSVKVILYNDSPEDKSVAEEFGRAKALLSQRIDCQFITNSENLGFIDTMNLAFECARNERANLLLLNSDAMLSRGALTEIVEVSEIDPMIGFVCPRSNNATLATIPNCYTVGSGDEEGLHLLEQRMRAALRFLPKYQYVPTGVGFCLYIKNVVLNNFGNLSTDYGKGYNEENDYIMRAGQVGFRAVLANWAYAFHEGEQSFQKTLGGRELKERANAGILNQRYPEYSGLVSSYFASEQTRAEGYLRIISSPKVRLAVDASALFAGHNGTVFLVNKLLRAINKLYGRLIDLAVMVDGRAAAYHALSSMNDLRILPLDTLEEFDVVLRIGQPFHLAEITRNSHRSPVNVYFMLDTIALDCAQLYSANLEGLWDFVTSSADGIIYNSKFTRDQFNRRFVIRPEITAQMVSYHSLNVEEYQQEFRRPSEEGSYVLIVGNHFPHKNVMPTYEYLIHKLPEHRYILIGGDQSLASKGHDRKDVLVKAGEMSQRVVDELYINASAVVFPSFYEGFGLPIEAALAAKRPVFAQRNTINLEISGLLNSPNIYLYGGLEDLAVQLSSNVQWKDDASFPVKHTWSDSATEIIEFCLQCLNASAKHKVVSRKQKLNSLVLSNFASQSRDLLSAPVLQADFDDDQKTVLVKSLTSFARNSGIKRTMFFFLAKKRRKYKGLRRSATQILSSLRERG